VSRPPAPLLAAFAALLLALSGCRATVTAGLDVDSEGKGTVRAALTLDDDAVRMFGDLAGELRVDDLRQAGWEVEGPRKEDDGLTWVRASRAFSGAEEANTFLAQLSGPEGPFRDLRLTRSRSLLRSTTRLTGVVDLAAGLAAFADSDLAARVGDTLPLDVDRLRQELGPDADQELQVAFEARLPGDVRANAPTEGDRAVWRPALGQQLRIEASSDAVALVPLVPVLAALLLFVVVGAAFLVWRRRRA
jgi:hypothetical protein